MGKYIYNEPVAYSPQDNKTYAAKRVYKFKECQNDLTNTNVNELWCNIQCPNDDDYCNPYYKGEKIYFQYFVDNSTLWKILPKIFNGDNDQPIYNVPGLVTIEQGKDDNGTSFYNVIIDTSVLDASIKCWYLTVGIFNCLPNPALYATCIATHLSMGQTPEQAEWECSVELCGPGFKQVYSEPYCEVPACAGKTLLLEGIYPKRDCNGNYYDDFVTSPPTNSFKKQIRVFGTIEKIGIDIEEKIVDTDVRVSGKRIDKYRFQTGKVPPYVANIIGDCFAAEKIFIDGVEYHRAISLQKSNDEGQMWIITTDLLIYCDENKFTCK